MKLVIAGYAQDVNCEHCGRALIHGIRLSDGRVVGADCLNKKMTKPVEKSGGENYRRGASYIINCANVVQLKEPSRWSTYGVSQQSITFEAA